jgi:hypothetical protein
MPDTPRRRARALVRELPADVILRSADLCDGHSIFKPQAFLDAGLPSSVVELLTTTHRSDYSDPKSTIFVNDRPVDELLGIHGLRMLQFLADALDVEYRRCFGRGTQAAIIREALHSHFAGSSGHRA